MDSDDNYHLKWNDFESNLGSAFQELRSDSELFDVTLVCGNGTDLVRAHRVVLVACSPLFRKILSGPNLRSLGFNGSTLLYLKGAEVTDLKAIMTFVYNGEVSVPHNSLEKFLSTAEDLEIKGLALPAVSTKHTTKGGQPRKAATMQQAVAPKRPYSDEGQIKTEVDVDVEDQHSLGLDRGRLGENGPTNELGSKVVGVLHDVEKKLHDKLDQLSRSLQLTRNDVGQLLRFSNVDVSTVERSGVLEKLPFENNHEVELFFTTSPENKLQLTRILLARFQESDISFIGKCIRTMFTKKYRMQHLYRTGHRDDAKANTAGKTLVPQVFAKWFNGLVFDTLGHLQYTNRQIIKHMCTSFTKATIYYPKKQKQIETQQSLKADEVENDESMWNDAIKMQSSDVEEGDDDPF